MPKKLKDWLARDHTAPWPLDWEAAYLQTELILGRSPEQGDPGGVCFRLAFKWLACQRSGREFVYVLRHDQPPVQKTPASKLKTVQKTADSTIKKQNAYLNAVAPYERPLNAPKTKGEYGVFRTNVDRESVNLLNLWGGKTSAETGGKKYGLQFTSTMHRSLVGSNLFNGDMSAIIGVYGKSDAGPWAHATAFHRDKGKALYFDSNGGEFTLDANDPAADLIQEDLERYVGDALNYTIKHYAVYRVV